MSSMDKSVKAVRPAIEGDELSWPVGDGRLRAVADGSHLSLRERLEYAVGLVEPEEWQDRIGRSERQVRRYLDGADIPLSVLQMISVASGLPLDWLVCGRPTTERQIVNQLGSSFWLIPLIETRASAGGGSVSTGEEVLGVLAFHERWLRAIGLHPKSTRAVVAVGDSMEPTISDGDLLLVDESIDRVVDHGIYVVVYQGMVLVKRVQLRLDGTLVLKSDNSRYDDEVVPPAEVSDIHIAGRVRWFGRTI